AVGGGGFLGHEGNSDEPRRARAWVSVERRGRVRGPSGSRSRSGQMFPTVVALLIEPSETSAARRAQATSGANGRREGAERMISRAVAMLALTGALLGLGGSALGDPAAYAPPRGPGGH